jgi:hypothetical protein
MPLHLALFTSAINWIVICPLTSGRYGEFPDQGLVLGPGFSIDVEVVQQGGSIDAYVEDAQSARIVENPGKMQPYQIVAAGHQSRNRVREVPVVLALVNRSRRGIGHAATINGIVVRIG